MSVFVNIISDFDNKGLKNAEGQLRNFASNAGKIAAGVTASLAAIGTGLAVRGFVNFTKQSISAASDLTESVNAVNVAFGEAAEGVLKIGESAAESLGVSQNEFNNAAVRFSAFAEDIAGAGGDVAGFIGDITTRATDFASVFNIDVAEALQVFQSGLSGEAEPLKRFGINLLQSEVNAFAMANGIGEVGRELTETEKVQARYGLLMEETNKTAGDFANTSDSLANRQRILQAGMTDLRSEFGTALLPAMESIVAITQEDLMPAFSDLAESIAPAVADIMEHIATVTQETVVPALQDFAETMRTPEGREQLERIVTALTAIGEASIRATVFVGENLDKVGQLIIAIGSLRAAWGLTVGAVAIYNRATLGAVATTNALRTALTRTGIGAAIVGAGFLVDGFVNATSAGENLDDLDLGNVEQQLRNLENQANNTANAIHTGFLGPGIDPNSGRSFFEAPGEAQMPKRPKPGQVFTWFKYGRDGQANWYQQRWTGSEWTDPELMTYDPPSTSGGGGGGTATKTAGDFVNEFFAGLDDAVAKETARMELEDLGISDALIDDILGAQGWSHVYDEVISGGQEMADSLQEQFNQTAEGAKELAVELERIKDLETAMGETLEMANSAGDGLAKLFEASENLGETAQGVQDYFDSLMGGVGDLLSAEEFDSVQKNMEDWFDRNLFTIETYANRRDALLQDRALANDLVFGTAEAITAAGDITTLINDTLNKTKEIDVSETIEGVVNSADGLRGFKTTLTKNYTEVIEDTANAADNLTSNFQGVVDRTKTFLENLEELKELGLDPMLFNQLVEAGVDAGGATAQALVDGGSETINEVNSLQTELEKLGVDIGEETYDTMKDAGEQFTSGIVDGIETNLDALEVSAETAAETFASAFEEELHRLLDDVMIDQIGGNNNGSAGGVTPSPGDFAPGDVTDFGDFGEVRKIRNQSAGKSLADIAAEFDVPFDKIKEANPKFFDSGHKDYKAGYKDGEYIYSNTLVNVPQLAKGGIAMDQVLAMIGEQGPEAVIPLNKLDGMMNGNGATYNIYVQSNTRSGGQQAGQEIVKALKQYQTANGSVNSALTGIGS